MFLEKVKEVQKTEQNAAELKTNVQIQAKKLVADAHEEGKRFLAETEATVSEQAKQIVADAEKKAAEILSKAKYDSKIETVARKVEAELNLPTAVITIINEVTNN